MASAELELAAALDKGAEVLWNEHVNAVALLNAPRIIVEDNLELGQSKSIYWVSPRICSRTLMGCSDPSVFSRGGSLLPSSYADARYIDDVIAF